MNSLTAALAFSIFIDDNGVCVDVVDEQRIEFKSCV